MLINVLCSPDDPLIDSMACKCGECWLCQARLGIDPYATKLVGMAMMPPSGMHPGMNAMAMGHPNLMHTGQMALGMGALSLGTPAIVPPGRPRR